MRNLANHDSVGVPFNDPGLLPNTIWPFIVHGVIRIPHFFTHMGVIAHEQQQLVSAFGNLAVFPIQDLIGIDGELRDEDTNSERINVPSNPKHYWKYRLHIDLKDLMKEDEFNGKLKKMILDSGRGSINY